VNRSAPLERRARLKRSTWLPTRKVLERRQKLGGKPARARLEAGKQLRRQPIQPQSAKRRAEKPRRDEVRRATVERAGYRCELAAAVPEVECWSPERDTLGRWWLDVDEVVSRGVRPGGHLDPTNTQAACRAHHDWRAANPREARRRGLRRRSTDQ
jgi:hypothetical protein